MADSDFDLTGRVRIDTTELEQLSGRIGSSLKGVAAAAAAAFVVDKAVDFGRSIVNVAANFQQAMSGISAVSGATAGQMDAIRQKALQLGADTSFSATEAASGIEELIKAGVSVDDVLNGAATASLNLAAAGGVELPQAATIAANAMNQFSLSGAQVPHVADLIAGAANASAIDVNQFGMSLAAVGAVAKTVGLNFDDTATAIALMGQKGIVSSDAGTSLKAMLLNLQPSTKAQTTLMKDLGIITATGANQFFDATGKVKNLAGISEVLTKALAGQTDQQRLANLETMFGSDAIRAGAVLSEAGAQGINDMAAAMGKVKAADVAATRLDNYNGAMERLRGSLETIGIRIGSAVLPRLTELVAGFDSSLPRIEGAITTLAAAVGPPLIGAFEAVSSFMRDNVVPILGAVAAALSGGLVVGISAAVSAIGAFIAAAGGPMAAVIAALGGPITLAIAGVAALTAGVIYAYQHFQGFRDIVDAVAGFIVARFGDLVAFGQEIFPQLQEAVGHVFNAIRDVITVAVDFVMAAWRLFGDDILRVGRGAFEAVRAVIETAINTVANIIRLVLAVINGDWGQAWNALKAIVGGIWDGIKGVVSGALNAIVGIIGGVYDGLKRAASVAFGAITDSIRDVVGGMFNIGRDIIGGIIRGIEYMGGALIGAFKRTVTDALPDFAQRALQSRSPSRVFARIGETIPAGMAQGISSGADAVTRAASDMLAIPNGANAFGTVGGALAGGGGSVTIGSISINGVANADDVRGVLPELTDALRAAVGAR